MHVISSVLLSSIDYGRLQTLNTHTHTRIKPEQFIVTFIISVKLFILKERKFFPTCCLKVTEIKQRKNKIIDFNFSLFSWAKFILERRELYHLLTVNNFYFSLIFYKSIDVSFLRQTGVKDPHTGEYIINLPSWSRTIYYNATKIEYEHKDNRYDDSIFVAGPTKIPIEIVVR